MSETGVRENGMVMEHTQNTAKKMGNLVKDTWVSFLKYLVDSKVIYLDIFWI